MTTSIRLTQRTSLIMLILNGMGAVLYLWWASHAWAIPQERAMGIQIGNHRKNLPNHPIQFATLEIEINLQPEDRKHKSHRGRSIRNKWNRQGGLFHVANFNRWTNLPITRLERRI
jgi:hypothetical protein